MRKLKEELTDILAPTRSEADLVVNWGRNKDFLVSTKAFDILNPPNVLRRVTNKVSFFEHCAGLPGNVEEYILQTPRFWTKREGVVAWMLDNPGKDVVCRTIINGHDGNGIVITNNPNEVPDCKLYTEYIKKKHEYRVHVFGEDVIKLQQKKRRSGVATNSQVRNSSNGWVFTTQGVNIPEDILENCCFLVSTLGLMFGALDIIHNEHYNKWYVLEVNSAPGIEGSTVKAYGDAIRSYLA